MGDYRKYTTYAVDFDETLCESKPYKSKVVFLQHSCACGNIKGFPRKGEICPKCGTLCLCISVSNDKDNVYYDDYYGRTNDFVYAYAKSYLEYVKIKESHINGNDEIEINLEGLK